MSCWNFTPSKNGPPHHIINPFTKPSFHLSRLPKSAHVSVHRHLKICSISTSFLHILKLMINSLCFILSLISQKDEIPQVTLQLPWHKGIHAKMLPWSCWNTANSQLHFLCRNLFGCPYPQFICTSSQRDLSLAPRESNLPAYYGEWELHMLESVGLFLSVNSCH